MVSALLLSLLFSMGAHAADVSRCDKVKAEADDLRATKPVACDEAKEIYDNYVKGLPEAIDICKKLEAEAAAGPVKLKLGTEDEMHLEIMDIKQRHVSEHQGYIDRVTYELFPTALDNNDPSRIPATVGSDCGTEVEGLVRFRKNLQRGISEFYAKIDADDDTLFQQAAERALPANKAPAVKTVR
jgi:hypothetical protein